MHYILNRSTRDINSNNFSKIYFNRGNIIVNLNESIESVSKLFQFDFERAPFTS